MSATTVWRATVCEATVVPPMWRLATTHLLGATVWGATVWEATGGYYWCNHFGMLATTHLSGAAVWMATVWRPAVWGLQSGELQSVPPIWDACNESPVGGYSLGGYSLGDYSLEGYHLESCNRCPKFGRLTTPHLSGATVGIVQSGRLQSAGLTSGQLKSCNWFGRIVATHLWVATVWGASVWRTPASATDLGSCNPSCWGLQSGALQSGALQSGGGYSPGGIQSVQPIWDACNHLPVGRYSLGGYSLGVCSMGGDSLCNRFGRLASTHLSGAAVGGATVCGARVSATDSGGVQPLTCLEEL